MERTRIKWKAAMKVMLPEAKECEEPTRSQNMRHMGDSSPEPPEGTKPENTSILAFQLPDCDTRSYYV